MKKALTPALTLLLALSLLTGCGQSGGTATPDRSSPAPAGKVDVMNAKTVGEVLGLESSGYSCNEELLVYAVEQDGKTYQVRAATNPELFDQILDLDYEDEDHDEKFNALIAPLEITQIFCVDDYIPTEADTAALVGKTGQELFDEGCSCYGYNLEDMTFYMSYGPFNYKMTFDGSVDESEWEDYDENEDLLTRTVTAASYEGIGDATNDIPGAE